MRIRRRQKTVIIRRTAIVGRPAGAFVLSAGSASYSIAGVSATFRDTVLAASGSYSVTGHAAALARSAVLSAPAASYTIAGQGVAFAVRGSDATGDYDVGGDNVSFGVARYLAGAAGSYAVTGASVQFKITIPIEAGTGDLEITGSSASLAATRRLTAGAGSVSLTGYQTELIYSAAVVVAPSKSAAGGGHRRRAAVQYVINEPPAPQVELRHFRLRAQADEYAITGAAAAFAVTRRPKPAQVELLREPDLPRKRIAAATDDAALARKRKLIAYDNEFLLMVA